jgi:hypothetical protein
MQWKGPHSRETITKAVVSLMIVLPIVLGIGWSSLIAAIWGLIFLPVGLILLVAAGFGLLFNYALVVSVWFNRRDELIVAGLCPGIIFLGVLAYMSLGHGFHQMRFAEVWTLGDAFYYFGFGGLSFLGTLLSLYLLFRKLPSVSRRPANPRAPILLCHADLPSGEEVTPKRGPYLPNRP